jgi:hypothetical protein
MEQIADWLEKLGMSEYAQRFVENRIDLSVLPELTDQDLKDLGVVLGYCRKILRAISDLGSAPHAAPSVVPASGPTSAAPPSIAAVGETAAAPVSSKCKRKPVQQDGGRKSLR